MASRRRGGDFSHSDGDHDDRYGGEDDEQEPVSSSRELLGTGSVTREGAAAAQAASGIDSRKYADAYACTFGGVG